MATRYLAPYTRAWRVADPLSDLHREVNRLFDDMFNVDAYAGGSGRQGSSMMAMPRVDLHETENELQLSAELPGVKSDELDVRLDGDVLTISGEKKSERNEQKQNYHVAERSYGRFQRSVQLPYAPEPEQVQAQFEHGVLNIRMPKRPEKQQGSRRIEIRGGSGGASGEASPVSAGASDNGRSGGSGGSGSTGTAGGASGGQGNASRSTISSGMSGAESPSGSSGGGSSVGVSDGPPSGGGGASPSGGPQSGTGSSGAGTSGSSLGR